MSNKTNPAKSSNPMHTKLWLKMFGLLMTMVKTLVFAICLLFLYTFFGDSFDFNFTKDQKIAQTTTRSTSIVDDDWDKVENGIHLSTGLIYDENFDLVRAHCTACHSGKLVAQNRATREGWQQMIRWMQATQGLWDLGVNEPKILDYLEKNYAPKEVGRRANIDMAAVEWYILELDGKK